jgi:hypothetical protein
VVDLLRDKGMGGGEAIAVLGIAVEAMLRTFYDGDEQRRQTAKFQHILAHVMATDEQEGRLH